MTQGFYEQLGVRPDADAQSIRDAYHRQVARLAKRVRQLREQGGDTAPLDLTRVQLDEAWSVLSVPERRQRYDAMLRFLDVDRAGVDTAALWAEVGPSLVPPSVAAAAALLRRSTQLAIPPVGRVAEAPSGRPRPVAHEEPTAPTLAPATIAEPTEATEPLRDVRPSIAAPRPRPVSKVAVERPTPVARIDGSAPVARVDGPAPVAHLQAVHSDPGREPRADLKLVDGTPRASSVIVLPPDAPRQKTLTPDEVARLIDIHGYSGGLIRAVREAKGVSLDEVAASTRISVRYLEAIEADLHDRLPSATFVKGYVREVARLLKLDEEAVVRGYMHRAQ